MNITTKIFLFAFIFLVALFPFLGAKAQESISGPFLAPEKIRVIYFYADDCANCAKVKPFIATVIEKYKDKIDFLEYNVKEKEECRQLFYQFLSAYNLSDENAKIPMIFAGNDYLLGASDIEKNLDAKISEKIFKKEDLKFDCHKFLEDWKKNGGKIINGSTGSGTCSVTQKDDSCSIGVNPGQTPGNIDSKKQAISLGLIITTAAIDSINPCAIAVLLFLIAVLISLKAARKRMLAVGLVYILGVFLSYYLAGIGIMKAIAHFDIARQINIFAGAIVMLAAFISVKEGLYPDSAQLLVIPPKTKKIFTDLMQKGTFAAVFIAGILVSAFELPCTGQVYLGILSLMSQENMKAQGYFYLFVYNLIFVLPLVLILIGAAWGLDIERLQKLRKESRGLIKILIGLIMFLLGAWLIYTTL